MTDFDQLIENSEQSFFDRRHGIFVKHLAVSLYHFDNQKSVLELIVNRIVSLIFNDFLEGSEKFGCKE